MLTLILCSIVTEPPITSQPYFGPYIWYPVFTCRSGSIDVHLACYWLLPRAHAGVITCACSWPRGREGDLCPAPDGARAQTTETPGPRRASNCVMERGRARIRECAAYGGSSIPFTRAPCGGPVVIDLWLCVGTPSLHASPSLFASVCVPW